MGQVAEVKQKINIVDLIGSYVALKKAGRNYKGVCPFHTEKTPSFMVSPELQIYKCFGCGEAGDIFSFVQKIEGIEFYPALEKLAEKAGIELEKKPFDKQAETKKIIYEINHLTSEFYHKILIKHPAGKKALHYLTDTRNINLSTIKEFKLGYAPDTWDLLIKFLQKNKYKISDMVLAGVATPGRGSQNYIDKFRGRVIFPLIRFDKKIVGFMGRTLLKRNPKYLNTSETLVFHKRDFVYGLDKARISLKKEGAIFVEGPVDVISAYQLGIRNILATSGTALTSEQLKLISRYTKDITFCFDSDTAGMLAIQRAIAVAEEQDFNIKVILIPEKYADLDDLINSDSGLAKELVHKSIPIYDFFLAKALKSFDSKNPIGKRKIVEELIPVFSNISNRVVFNHYVKQLSEKIKISEEVLSGLLRKRSAVDDYSDFKPKSSSSDKDHPLSKKSFEEYFLVLLIKSSIDITKPFLYKLGKEDFSDHNLQQIFVAFKRFAKDSKDFDVKDFVETVDDSLRELIYELYLWDITDLLEQPENLLKELDKVYTRLKKVSTKRKLQQLTDDLKLAELEKDKEKIIELSEEIKKISKKLI